MTKLEYRSGTPAIPQERCGYRDPGRDPQRELDVRDDDVGGIAVHIAARIMAAAGPGEILVSRTVRDLVTGSGITLEDRGTHTLRGLSDPWQLFAAS